MPKFFVCSYDVVWLAKQSDKGTPVEASDQHTRGLTPRSSLNMREVTQYLPDRLRSTTSTVEHIVVLMGHTKVSPENGMIFARLGT